MPAAMDEEGAATDDNDEDDGDEADMAEEEPPLAKILPAMVEEEMQLGAVVHAFFDTSSREKVTHELQDCIEQVRHKVLAAEGRAAGAAH